MSVILFALAQARVTNDDKFSAAADLSTTSELSTTEDTGDTEGSYVFNSASSVVERCGVGSPRLDDRLRRTGVAAVSWAEVGRRCRRSGAARHVERHDERRVEDRHAGTRLELARRVWRSRVHHRCRQHERIRGIAQAGAVGYAPIV